MLNKLFCYLKIIWEYNKKGNENLKNLGFFYKELLIEYLQAFILKLSKDLDIECKNYGIKVHCLITGPVTTKLFNVKITEWITPNPETYAKSALRNIGMCDVTTGYSSHDVLVSDRNFFFF